MKIVASLFMAIFLLTGCSLFGKQPKKVELKESTKFQERTNSQR